MKITAVHDHIVRIYRAGNRETRLLLGEPGIGKTSIIRQAAQSLSISYRSFPATVLDPLDIGGLPAIRPNGDGRDHAIRMPFTDLIPGDGAGILVFEDLTTAPPLTQASLYSLTWDRHVGSFYLGPDWLVVCTANRDEDNAATQRMPTPLVNRMEHLMVEPDFPGWERYMAANGRSPIVRAYLHMNPERFVDFDPHRPGPFPTARSWEACAALFDAYAPDEPPEGAVAGWIGPPDALQLLAFVRANASLVSPAAVFANPESAPIPKQLSSLWVLVNALANAARAPLMPALCRFLDRLSPEHAIYCLKSSVLAEEGRIAKAKSSGERPEPRLVLTDEWRSVCRKHEDLMR